MNTTNKGINYNFDDHLEFKDVHTIETAEGFSFQISELQKNPVDIRVNSNTNLILTQKNINSRVLVDRTRTQRNIISIPDKLTTYLAPVKNTAINLPSQFIAIDESLTIDEITCTGIDAEVETINNSISGIENRHFFELEFLKTAGNFVKISHYDTRKTLYLTYNHMADRLYFDFENAPGMSSRVVNGGCFSLTEYSDLRRNPQIFEYRLDDRYGYITLSKSRPREDSPGLETVDISSEQGFLRAIPSSILSLGALDSQPSFKIDLPTDISSEELRSSIVSYDRVDLDINPDTIIPDTKQNILLYDEFKSGKNVPVNMIFLKNQFPNTFEHTTNNIVPGSNRADYRDYTSIISGNSQIRGTDKVGVIFNDHTAEIKLKPSQLTYFHLPVETYPYNKLYISDSGLIESGAIFGDAPVNSDKIFKKLASYKQSTPNGTPTDDLIGVWACSWLYSPTGEAADAIWVDRYYDSSTHSFTNALQSSITTLYDSIIEVKNNYNVLGENVKGIFDIKSTMMLEPDTYYAYHHIGTSDIETYISKEFGDNIIAQDVISRDLNTETTYPLDSVDTRAGTTISFTIEKDQSASWADPIAYHIIGNYTNNGVSVFNNLKYTPIIYGYTANGSNVKMFNEDMVLLNDINNEVTDPTSSKTHTKARPLIETVIKFMTIIEPLGNIYCLVQDDDNQLYIYEYSMTGGVEEFSKLHGYSGTVHSVCSYDRMLCVYVDDTPISVDLITELVTHKIDSSRVKIDRRQKTLRLVGELYQSGNSIRRVDPLEDKLMFRGDDTEGNVTIKSFTQTPTGEVFIIYSDTLDGGLRDYVVGFSKTGDRLFVSTSITEYLREVGVEWNPSNSTYKCITHYDGNLNQDHQIHIFTEVGNTLRHLKMSSTGSIISENQITSDIDMQSITNFSYFQEDKPNTITIKHKLRNLINRDDVTDIVIDIDVLEKFYGDKHHIIYDFDPQSGTATVYIDGEIHNIEVLDDIIYEDTGNTKPPGKFTFSLFHTDDIRVGSIPYINNSSLSSFIRKQTQPINTNFKISDFKMFNRSLNKYIARQLAIQTDQIDSITWTIPYTKRHFIDSIDKVQKHEIPGNKSNKMSINLHSNEDMDDNLIKDISTDINNKIRDFIPSNVNLTSIDWI